MILLSKPPLTSFQPSLTDCRTTTTFLLNLTTIDVENFTRWLRPSNGFSTELFFPAFYYRLLRLRPVIKSFGIPRTDEGVTMKIGSCWKWFRLLIMQLFLLFCCQRWLNKLNDYELIMSRWTIISRLTTLLFKRLNISYHVALNMQLSRWLSMRGMSN